MELLRECLEELSAVPSVSGFEDRFSDLIRTLIRERVDRVEGDALGNVIAFKKGKGKNKLKLLFEAHLDQIGLMITGIEKNGILRFTGIGGVNPLTLYGKRVRILASEKLYGIIGMTPPHLVKAEDKESINPIENLHIDAGFGSQQEARNHVDIGDVAVVDYRSEMLAGGHFCTSGLDNKAGVLTLISAIRALGSVNLYHDAYFLFAVQEEVGLRGAKVGGFTLSPHAAVVCDVTFADPIGDGMEIKTGKGPVVGKGPNYSPQLVRTLCEVAEREDIPIQEDIEIRPGGTDAFVLQVIKRGVYSAGLFIPLRYMHSQVEMINLKDAYRAAKLMLCLALKENLLSAGD
jgi:putative aminopeptidase FrvX